MSTPSLLNIPYRFKAGTLYSQLPETGAGDFTVSRTTNVANRSTRINSLGNIEIVNDNVPRLDYPVGGAVNGCPALLVEPSAQNLALQSADFNTTWTTQFGATVNTNTAISPDGTQNADTINLAAVNDSRVRQTITLANSTTYTMSCFYKNIALTAGQTFRMRFNNLLTAPNNFIAAAVIDLAAGTATYSLTGTATTGFSGTATGRIENYGNGWYRVSVTFTVGTGGGAAGIFEAGSVDPGAVRSFYAWGAQLETSSVPTSYIPTTTAPITRNTETIANTSATALIGQSEGTLYWDIAAVAGVLSGTGNPMFGVRNSATTNWVSLISNSPSSPFRIAAQATTGNLINYTVNITSGKAALAWSSAGLALYVNGSLVATSATNPNFSFSVAEFVGYAPFKANAFAIYPNRIPNTAPSGILSLQSLTT